MNFITSTNQLLNNVQDMIYTFIIPEFSIINDVCITNNSIVLYYTFNTDNQKDKYIYINVVKSDSYLNKEIRDFKFFKNQIVNSSQYESYTKSLTLKFSNEIYTILIDENKTVAEKREDGINKVIDGVDK